MSEEVNLAKALNEATDSEGGYLVPEVWATRIYELIVAKSTAIQLCEQTTMTSDTLYFPKVTGASTAYFTDEAATITASDPAFGQIVLTPKKVAGLIRVSSELLEDSNPSVSNVIAERLATDIALKVDYEIYNGTANFIGFRENTEVLTSDLAGGEISTDAISDAIEKLQSENIEPTDMVIHPKIANKLRKLKDNDERPIFNVVSFGSTPLRTGIIGTIWGINIINTTQLPTDLTTGTFTSLTDIVMVAKGKCGIYARRREMRMNKFYLIDTDDWKVQANMRSAFVVNYEKAVCIIQNVKTI